VLAIFTIICGPLEGLTKTVPPAEDGTAIFAYTGTTEGKT
jgi:hypothetical protein